MTTTRAAAKQQALRKQRLTNERRAQATALVMMELAKRGIYAPVRTPRAPQMKRRAAAARSKLRFPPVVTHQGYGPPTPGRGKGLMVYPRFYSAME
jgi:hypothetical protein